MSVFLSDRGKSGLPARPVFFPPLLVNFFLFGCDGQLLIRLRLAYTTPGTLLRPRFRLQLPPGGGHRPRFDLGAADAAERRPIIRGTKIR